MTEKRFTFTQDTLAKADVFDGSEFICCTLSVWVEQLVDLLNQLNDENIEMHIQNDFLKDENQHMRDLVNENEQLKDILKDITIQLDANHTMNTYQMVIPINRVIYNELNRRLKETSFNEELRRFLDD